MKWFKHDSSASTDAKLKKVRLKYGMEGYGLYWLCLEYVAMNVEKHNLTFELEHDSELLSNDTGIHQELIQEMMTFMCDLGLFENDRGVITCLKMSTRTDEYTQKLINSQRVVGTLSGQTPDSVGTMSDLIEENKENKKNRREQKSKADKIPPSISEVTEYCRQMGYKIDPAHFLTINEERGWKTKGGQKIVSWKATARKFEENRKKWDDEKKKEKYSSETEGGEI